MTNGRSNHGRGAGAGRALAGLSAWALFLLLAGECIAAPSYLRYGPSKKPTDAEVAAAWPAEAAKAGIEGTAAALCEVDRTGVLSACRVILEDPVGRGFGEALLGLSSKYGLKPLKQLCSEYFHQTVITLDWTEVERSAQWSSQPRSQDYTAAYPEEAYRRGIGGATALFCGVNEDGSLKTCRVIYDSAPELGFGAAALSVAPRFRMKPVKGTGKPLSRSVVIPVNFWAYNGVILNC